MYTVTLLFHDDLNFFLPSRPRDTAFTVTFKGKRSVKDLIESLGVPHVEADIIIVREKPAGFTYMVMDGDHIEIYPYDHTQPVPEAVRLIPPPYSDPRFICDVHLRKLARSLRLLGFDVRFDESLDDAAISLIALSENRIILTRDRRLLMRKVVTLGYTVRSTDPDEQIIEILRRFHLLDRCSSFTRCIECNGNIEWLDLSDESNSSDISRIPPGVIIWCDEYYRCAVCRRIYWKGSHYDRLIRKTETILGTDTRNDR